MSELDEKVKKSIERLQSFCPEEGYYLAFSGGKDSVVCKALLDMSGCKYDATYRVTSVDPPELVRFIKDQHPDVTREVPRYSDKSKNEKLRGKPINMWNLIAEKKKYPPTRRKRFCCEYLKESGGDGRVTVTGVRWEESKTREDNQGIAVIHKLSGENLAENIDFKINKAGSIVLVNDNDPSRRLLEQCYKRHKTTVNPIIDWTESEVWAFIKGNGIPYCELYDEGFSRLGCIGCPIAQQKQREKEFLRWPKYKTAYLSAFEKMLVARRDIRPFRIGGMDYPNATAADVFNWWMEYDVLPGQFNLFEDYEEE